MREHRHFISIWFFIGVLLTAYGILILGSGIYDLFKPLKALEHQVVLANLHAPIWWGALLLALGSFYAIHFRPGKE